MTENNHDSPAGAEPGAVSPWSAHGGPGASAAPRGGQAGESGDRTPAGEQGPGRVESGPLATGEQGPGAPGAGHSAQEHSPHDAASGQATAHAAYGTGETPVPSHQQQWSPWAQQGQPQQGYGGALHGSAVPHHSYAGQNIATPFQQAQPQQAAPPRRSGGLVVGIAVLALVVGGVSGGVGGYLAADRASSSSAPFALDTPPTASQTGSAPAGSVEAVAQKVLPSVVQLRVVGRNSAGAGTGFIVSGDGLIITNNHVVEGAAGGGQITVVFQNGRTAEAIIVGRDPTSDVAVVRARGVTDLPVADLGRSDDLRVGQGVVAIGSPFELAGTVTSGIVSSLNRPTRAGGQDGSQATVLDAIQTDAAINPGNSGGPLVNMAGQIIGINSAIYSPTSSASAQGGSVGIGFSIPINQARRTVDEIVRTGKATQTVLGVSVRDADQGSRGALIVEVVGGAAGEAAGIKQGDIVTKLNDRRIESADALVAAVRSHAPGDKVSLVIGDNNTVEVTLGGQPVEVE
ncbi:S1C family serine protease [Actinokineospora pegani]|uniref:S1C family serine protease n=1 Tax=Actinokineospora pegani TaxID=2654637 RepID=UPI0012EA1478|nr:trypsin-like peptidase domain-containing protein [Actinokineospora pegani]